MLDTINVQVIKADFGRHAIAAQIGDFVIRHSFLFKPEHKTRAESLVAQITAKLCGSNTVEEAFAQLNASFWTGPMMSETIKRTVYKPKDGNAA
jgi:hypothetical protein